MATRWALLRLIGRRHADAEPLAQGSDGQREFVERDRHPLVHWLLAREIVVPTSQVLQEPGSWPIFPTPGAGAVTSTTLVATPGAGSSEIAALGAVTCGSSPNPPS